MKILHSSDLHGQYKRLLYDHKDTDFDVWVDTGDFFPNHGRVPTGGAGWAMMRYRIAPHLERKHQLKWFGWKQLRRRFAEWLNGRPAIIQAGNHDFIHLALALAGPDCNVHKVTPAGVQVLGRTWAGFREINWIDGEWLGESRVDELKALVDETLLCNPDMLITHAPPHGILDEEDGYGVAALTNALSYQEHNVKVHLFGHCHRDGGKSVEQNGVWFHNSATKARLIEVD